MHRPARTLSLLTLAATGLLAGAGCADRISPQPPTASETGGITRYCALVAEVNVIGERLFTDMPDDAPPAEVGRRQGLLVEQASTQLAEMQQVAPAEIHGDVTVFLTDLRARATALQGPDPAAAQAAEERIRNFETQHCALGPDGS